METPTQHISGPVVLQGRRIFIFLSISFAFLLYLFALMVYVLYPQLPISFGAFSNWSLGLSVLLCLFLCFTWKPHIVADNQGIYFNLRFRTKKIAWHQIKHVEWRAVEQGVPGAYGAGTYVVRMNPVLKDHQDKDLAVIDYAFWGRNETEQTQFIEFVGQQIKATS